MIKYTSTYAKELPAPIEITETKIFIADNIQQVERTDEFGTSEQVYMFDLTVYDKDEYILLLAKQSQEIKELKEELEAAKIIVLGVE